MEQLTTGGMLFGMVLGIVLLGMAATFKSIHASRAGWKAWVCYQIAAVHRLLFSRCVLNNRCTIPESGPAIIVANHTSPVDPILLWTGHFSTFRQPHLRVIGYLMAREYYDHSAVIKWVCRAMECIPVDRNGRDVQPVKLALRRLQEGRLLGLFPEGRLNQSSPETCLLAADTGVAWLALKANVPVLPVFIHQAPRSDSMVRCFFVRTRSRLTYGPPLDLSPWRGTHWTQDQLADVTDLIMKSIADLGGIQFTPTARREAPASAE